MNAARPVLELFASTPDRIAIREPDGRAIDCAALRAQTVAFAQDLGDAGLDPGDRVVLQVPNGISFAVTALGVLLAGGVPVLAEPTLGADVYAARLRAASPRWLIVHRRVAFAQRVPGAAWLLQRRGVSLPPAPRGIPRRVVVDARSLARRASTNRGELEVFEPDPRDDAVLVFTGGTTDEPKGARLSHGALHHFLANIAAVTDPLDVATVLTEAPQQTLYALYLGKSVVASRGLPRARADFLMSQVRSDAVDAYFGPPSVWTDLLERTGPDRTRLRRSLRVVLLGGAPVTPSFLRTLRAWTHEKTQVQILYGLTEAGPVCTLTAEDKLAWTGEGDLVGAPLPGLEVSVRGSGDVGAIEIRGPSLYSGYLGEPDRAAASPLETGDLGRLVRVNGREMLVLMGRAKDMIVRDGVNIYPSLLEPTISAAAGLDAGCALVGIWNPDREDEDVVLCFAGSSSAAAVRRSIEPLLGPGAAPDHYLPIDSIPVTGRQAKVDKAAVRRFAAAQLGRAAAERPS